jgi:hypothetical protein
MVHWLCVAAGLGFFVAGLFSTANSALSPAGYVPVETAVTASSTTSLAREADSLPGQSYDLNTSDQWVDFQDAGSQGAARQQSQKADPLATLPDAPQYKPLPPVVNYMPLVMGVFAAFGLALAGRSVRYVLAGE